MGNVEQFLSELAGMLVQKLEGCRERVERVVAGLGVDVEEYRHLLVKEVIDEVAVDAMFAFPPHNLYTPDEIREKALKLLDKFLERDERLFCGAIP